MFQDELILFRDYMGQGLIMILFFAAEFYLLLAEKKKHLRILLIYTPVILLVLFFNPIFYKVLFPVIGFEIYYRILWLIPFSVIIAYAVMHAYDYLLQKQRNELQLLRKDNPIQAELGIQKKGLLFLGASALCIMLSGSYIYSSPLFSKAENTYHMPQSVVDICDAIEVPGREIMAVFPGELLQYVRQYSPLVRMPYGREMLVSRWGYEDPLYTIMEKKRINVKKLCREAGYKECHYIILPEEKPRVNGEFTEYGYEYFDTIQGYIIYRSTKLDFSLDKK